MTNTPFVPLTLSALLLASPLTIAEDAQHPETATATESDSAPAAAPAEANADTSGAGGGMRMDPGATGSAMIAGQENQGSGDAEDGSQGVAMGPGMMMGGPGMMGCRRMMSGMMGGPGMMGRQEMTGGPGMMSGPRNMGGPRMMARRGMTGQGMGRGAGMGLMPRGGMCGGQYAYSALISRLELLDARMAKIETMLDWLLQR
jgi:hypothetical protein